MTVQKIAQDKAQLLAKELKESEQDEGQKVLAVKL